MSTSEQEEAITASTDYPIAIVACPGSGKTYTIIHRISFLLNHGFRPYDLLVITFTRKAALELRERTKGLGIQDCNFTVSTFHSFGLSILRRFGGLVGLDNFRIISQSEQYGILQQVAGITNIDKEILLKLQIFKTQGTCDDEFSVIFEKYNDYLRNQKICDYTDLILLSYELVKRNKEVKEYYQRRYKYVLIDEMQDVSKIQFDLIKIIFGDLGRITVVGDDDQTIYKWRGANSRLLLDFPKMFNNAKIIRLTKCFRCPCHIVKSMSRVIQNNKIRVKKIITSNKTLSGVKKIRVYGANSLEDEASLILNDIERINSHESIAILYRTRKAALIVKSQISKRNLKMSVSDKARFLESKDVNIILNYLQMYTGIPYNEKYIDNKSKRIILKYFIAMKNDKNFLKINSLKNTSQKSQPSIEFLDDDSNIKLYEEDLKEYVNTMPIQDVISLISSSLKLNSENVQLLAKNAEESNEPIKDFLYNVRTESNEEIGNKGINLSTVHQAKGLEWDNVFIIGVNKGNWPSRTSDDEIIEEERRLFYVAMSRAKKDLTISYIKDPGPSHFIEEIPELYIKEKIQNEDNNNIKSIKPKQNQKLPLTFCSVLQLSQSGKLSKYQSPNTCSRPSKINPKPQLEIIEKAKS